MDTLGTVVTVGTIGVVVGGVPVVGLTRVVIVGTMPAGGVSLG